ncbi:hypothetical protein BDV93DRAFT_609726 [Ceratobasidium sp. AG-I]|nr:hypothetical protein BDV93DRAFT_609726 [Ceratobasidium sp. AG-I]
MAAENELIAPRRKSEHAGANSASLLLAPQPPSPFPSPSSSFVPPPAQEPHEFANKTNVRMAAAKQPRSASHSRHGSEDSRGRRVPPSDPATSSPIPLEPPALAPSTPTSSTLSPAPLTIAPKRFSADSGQSSLSSSRPAPASPALSRHSSLLHNGSRKRLSTLSIVSTPPAAPRRSLLVRIRDFAFPKDDERHVGRGPFAKRSSVASSAGSGRGGWLGRVLGRKRNGDGGGDDNSDYPDANSSQDESDDPYYSDEEDELAGGGDEDGEAPFVPGLYRALYAFEPEGTAEMALAEDQQVRVLGRGGGVGWVVVLKPDGVEQALVPEGYLELVRPDDEDDDEESVGGGTEAPQTPRALS